MKHLSDEEIEQAKRTTKYVTGKPFHQHLDCIRIAYQWLDTQNKTKFPNKRARFALKHLIEEWGGRYVSSSDVEVAATLHTEIKGRYPCFNISSRLTRPLTFRLKDIPEAFKHMDYCFNHRPNVYGRVE